MTTKYFSYTPQEHGLLDEIRHLVDTRLYRYLKEKVDFKTGRLDHPSAQKLTLSGIARQISLPAKERAAALTFSHQNIGLALERLQAIGLIDEINRSGRYLRLRLPMVAMSTSEAKPSQNQSGGQIGGRKTTKTIAAQGIEGSVCKQNGGQSGGKNNEKSAETVAGQGFADVENPPLSIGKPSVLKPLPLPPHGGEKDLMLSASETQNQPHTAAKRLVEGVEKAKPETPESRYQAAIVEAGNGMIMYTNSEQSRKIYRLWEARSVDIRDVCEAVKAVIKSPTMKPTPNSVDAFLITAQQPKATKRNLDFL